MIVTVFFKEECFFLSFPSAYIISILWNFWFCDIHGKMELNKGYCTFDFSCVVFLLQSAEAKVNKFNCFHNEKVPKLHKVVPKRNNHLYAIYLFI